MSTLAVPGANLHYDTRGHGPLLSSLPGAPGVGSVFSALAPGSPTATGWSPTTGAGSHVTDAAEFAAELLAPVG